MLDTAQSMAFIIFGLIIVVILLRILAIVHAQAKRMRELETQLGMTDIREKIELEEEQNG